MKKYASEYYTGGKGNCAQAVAAAWQRKTVSSGSLIEQLAGCGHGKAPEGVCGALHAINCITDKETAAKLAAEFSRAAGGHKVCKDIRSARILKCSQCVEVAADLLDRHLDSSKALNG